MSDYRECEERANCDARVQELREEIDARDKVAVEHIERLTKELSDLARDRDEWKEAADLANAAIDHYQEARDRSDSYAEGQTKAINEAIAIFRGFRAGCSICDDEGHELDWRDIDRRCREAIAMLEASVVPLPALPRRAVLDECPRCHAKSNDEAEGRCRPELDTCPMEDNGNKFKADCVSEINFSGPEAPRG